LQDELPSIVLDEAKQAMAQSAEDRDTFTPAKKVAFVVLWWDDVIAKYEAYPILTRRQVKLQEEQQEKMAVEDGVPDEDSFVKNGVPEDSLDPLPFPASDPWTYPPGVNPPQPEVETDFENRSHLLLSIEPELLRKFIEGYKSDAYFRNLYVEDMHSPNIVLTPSRFQKGSNGLLYFLDASWNLRLCVPRSMVPYILSLTHDSASESAHVGPRRFLARVKELFYWPLLARDTEGFTDSCDVCQKVKEDHRQSMGGLRPAHIPLWPFATVSMDLITGLPPSGPEKYTAILVIIDKLTKYTIIVPIYN
jgi:hypothetical protein